MKRLLLVLVLLLTAGQATATQNLLFIMDASGSMWGRVDGEPKIVLARDVLADLVASLPDATNAGLIAYGHNRKGDCEDIETLVPLAPLQREAMTAQIGKLNPKGKTPITGAIAEATAILQHIEQTTSVILVSDGLESCGGDPCQAVRDARAAGIDFHMHVVGFDLGDADTAQLQCMADAGGGRYFSATNASELGNALDEAVSLAPEPEPAVEVGGGKLLVTVSSNRKPIRARTYLLDQESGEEVSRSGTDSAGLASYEVAPGEGMPVKARTYMQDVATGEELARSRTNARGVAEYTVATGTYQIKVRPDSIEAENRFIRPIEVTAGGSLKLSLDFADE